MDETFAIAYLETSTHACSIPTIAEPSIASLTHSNRPRK